MYHHFLDFNAENAVCVCLMAILFTRVVGGRTDLMHSPQPFETLHTENATQMS